MSVTLHHFTSRAAWLQIVQAGVLRAHSNPYTGARPASGVVWLTTSDTPEGLALEPAGLQAQCTYESHQDKKLVRITVDVPRSWQARWPEWVPRNGGTKAWVDRVRQDFPVGTWRVGLRDIPHSMWVQVVDVAADPLPGMPQDMVLWPPPAPKPVDPRRARFKKLY